MVVDIADEPGKLSDSALIIRMLYYCSTPRTFPEIMFYSGMDRARLTRIAEHCIKRNLVKFIRQDTGSMALVLTEHGDHILSETEDIMKLLNLGPEDL